MSVYQNLQNTEEAFTKTYRTQKKHLSAINLFHSGILFFRFCGTLFHTEWGMSAVIWNCDLPFHSADKHNTLDSPSWRNLPGRTTPPPRLRWGRSLSRWWGRSRSRSMSGATRIPGPGARTKRQGSIFCSTIKKHGNGKIDVILCRN